MTDRPGPLPRLHVVTDDGVLARDGWSGEAARVLEAGGAAVALHVRGPRTTGRRIFDLTRGLLAEARSSGAWLVVNDRVDVAIATGADAVHLGQRSLSARRTRTHLLPRGSIGVSCHNAAEVSRGRADGADYAFAGTVFTTASHREAVEIGVEGFREIVTTEIDFPILAIGGVAVESTAGLILAGAHGVAVVSGVWDAAEPAAAAAAYMSAVETALDQEETRERRA